MPGKRKLRAGVGAKCSCQLKYLRPEEIVAEKFDAESNEWMDDLVALRKEKKKVNGRNQMCIVLSHDDFPDQELHCVQQRVRVDIEGSENDLFAQDEPPKKVQKKSSDKERNNEQNAGKKKPVKKFKELSQYTWRNYGLKMFPAKPLEGKLCKLLRELIEASFSFDPLSGEDDFDEDFCEYNTGDNYEKFCWMVAQEDSDRAGLSWINALHQFSETGPDSESELDTPLTYVLKTDQNDWKTVQLLLQAGADVNMRDSLGQPPLFIAMQNEARWKVTHPLMESGANVGAVYSGKTLYQWAQLYKKESPNVKMIWDEVKRKVHGGFVRDDRRLRDDSSDDDDEDF